MTFSEFGRRAKENGSRGTDHGSAAPMFLVGGKVKAGVARRASEPERSWRWAISSITPISARSTPPFSTTGSAFPARTCSAPPSSRSTSSRVEPAFLLPARSAGTGGADELPTRRGDARRALFAGGGGRRPRLSRAGSCRGAGAGDGGTARLFPAAVPEAIRRTRVVTEHAATFSAVPGVDRWRPPQESPLSNLFVAGDWTATGWPATMEGSGAQRLPRGRGTAAAPGTSRDARSARPGLSLIRRGKSPPSARSASKGGATAALAALRAGGDAQNPEAEVVVAVAGIVPVAVGGAAVVAVVVPRPAAHHTIARPPPRRASRHPPHETSTVQQRQQQALSLPVTNVPPPTRQASLHGVQRRLASIKRLLQAVQAATQPRHRGGRQPTPLGIDAVAQEARAAADAGNHRLVRVQPQTQTGQVFSTTAAVFRQRALVVAEQNEVIDIAQIYSTRGGLTQARSASDGTVPSLALRACVKPARVEYSSGRAAFA